MSVETSLVALLQGICPRVFPDFADVSTQRPYVTYQGIGGPSISYIEGALPDKRCSWFQVNAWASSRAEALSLIRAIEAAMVANTEWACKPMAEPQWEIDEELQLRGCRQDFSVWAAR